MGFINLYSGCFRNYWIVVALVTGCLRLKPAENLSILADIQYNVLSFVAKEPHCLQHAVPWSLNICSTQGSPVHHVQMHGALNRDTHLYPPHSNSAVYLTTTYVPRSGRLTDGMWSVWTTLRYCAPSSPTSAPTFLEWPCQEQRGFGSL